MGLFRAKTQENLDTIRQKLAVAEARVETIEQRLSDVSLECALSGDFAPAAALGADLKAAIERVSVLQRALVLADQAEYERLQAARERELRSRLRAFKGQMANLCREAGEYESAVALQERAWRNMVDAAASARALLPPAGRDTYNGIFERSLISLCERELARIGRRDPMLSQEPPLPGSDSAALLLGTLPRSLPPISIEIRRLADLYGQQLAKQLGYAPSADAEPATIIASVAVPIPDGPDVVQDHFQQVTTTAEHLPALEMIMAGTAGNPHPPGSEAYFGYELAVAQIQRRPPTLIAAPHDEPAAPMAPNPWP